MENNKKKKSVKFQGDMLNFCDFIQVFVFTTNHHLKGISIFGPGDHIVQRSGTVGAVLDEGHPGSISVKLFQNPSSGLGGEVV